MSGRYYRALSQMHQQVQEKIDVAEQSRQPDWFLIGELKRLKLSIKDRMRSVLEDGREALSQGPLSMASGGQACALYSTATPRRSSCPF